MSHRLFEDKAQVSAYKRHRVSPPETIIGAIMGFLESKKEKPFTQALDVGCGSGQGTVMLAPHFLEVVGTDISPAQLEVARAECHPANVSYRECPAEELPFPDGSADLVTSMTAAHWFDWPRFLSEACRLLKPGGCLVLLSYTMDMELRYRDCSDRLNAVCAQFYEALRPYRPAHLGPCSRLLYRDMYESVPFPDKKWCDGVQQWCSMPLSRFMGIVESFTSYQLLLKRDPRAAQALSHGFQSRLLELMAVSSPDTVVDVATNYFYFMACKPAAAD
ncbi:ubiquinone/menaquinone biosynthesis C-methyltransferase UbiE isoform X2 [Amia ocellicauda]|uniref:ubiquinone/menaquinone biosynthesis C-methyltransferase UbiE isoform X2 n=1 Tax=Amia ocellicauda TaxID=2972642 RepID=UPI0034638D24